MISVSDASRPWRRTIGVTALFTALTAVMTWPQPLGLGTLASDHPDVYFNLWRMRWIHYALSNSPASLFDANQFFPERQVLAFSDAMLVEGIIALPLLALGLAPVLVHNLLLLGAIAASGVGMFVLARYLSGNTAGGVAAGIVFAFAPYRFDHYMHMELQWTVWIPWAFWAVQRTLDTGALKFGVLAGVFLALQMMSSIYYGVFLGVVLALVGAVQLMNRPARQRLGALRALAPGAVIAASTAALYAAPYADAASRVGSRSEVEVRMFSAKPRNYVSATEENFLYGARRRSRPEKRLFPGILAPVLALVGLLLVTPRAASVAYLIGLATAFELSLGLNGIVYPYLYQYVPVFQGLRAPARASILCLLCLGVLAAQGWAAVASDVPQRARQALAFVFVGALLIEYWVAPLPLVPYRNTAPPLYEWLARQPPGVVAEFPMRPELEPRYLYMSTFHWKPLVNGYSGYHPPSYIQRTEVMKVFPELPAIARLKSDGVNYVVVHSTGYDPEERTGIVRSLTTDTGLSYIGEFDDGWGAATVFRLR